MAFRRRVLTGFETIPEPPPPRPSRRDEVRCFECDTPVSREDARLNSFDLVKTDVVDVTDERIEDRDTLYEEIARTGILPQKEQSEGTYLACSSGHWLARDGEMSSIAVVGATQTAKSTFLAGLFFLLAGIRIPSVDAILWGKLAEDRFFDLPQHVFEHGQMLDSTLWSTREDIIPYVMSLSLAHVLEASNVVVPTAVYDFSGEMTSGHERLVNMAPFTPSVNALLFFFSPNDIPQLNKALTPDGPDRVSPAMNTLGAYARTWRLRNGLPTAGRTIEKVSIPTCIIINKADVLCDLPHDQIRYTEEIRRKVKSRVDPPRDLDDHRQRLLDDTQFVVELLRTSGSGGLVDRAFREFEHPSFHLASPLGSSPPNYTEKESETFTGRRWTPTEYTLSGICDPFIRAAYAAAGEDTYQPDRTFLEALKQ